MVWLLTGFMLGQSTLISYHTEANGYIFFATGVAALIYNAINKQKMFRQVLSQPSVCTNVNLRCCDNYFFLITLLPGYDPFPLSLLKVSVSWSACSHEYIAG